MDLERELGRLEIDWPETPPLRLELARRRRRRWPLALAVAAAALAAAFAVPQSRGAILRFLDFGGVTVERVDTLPAAQERPLGADLGPAVTLAQATAALGTRPLLPDASVTLHLSGPVVSMLFTYGGSPVLLSEFGSDNVGLLKKIAGTATNVVSVSVGGHPGVWLSGAPHVFLFPSAPPRLAGNVLLWARNGLTLRLEGAHLTRGEALTLSLRNR
jgi:hypothetical protein